MTTIVFGSIDDGVEAPLVVTAENSKEEVQVGRRVLLAESEEFDNSPTRNRVDLELRYKLGHPGQSVFIDAVLQHRDTNGTWHNTAHQLRSFRRNDLYPTQTIQRGPSIQNPYRDVLDVVLADDNIEQVSPHPGTVPPGADSFRVQVFAKDTSGEFESLEVFATIEFSDE